jgi:hypothetical protein
MTTAQELAAKIRENANALIATGGYSVEAESLILIAMDLADLADKVAALENLAKTDIGKIVDAIMEGRKAVAVDEAPLLLKADGSSR